VHFSSEMKRKSADRQNNGNSKYEPTVFSACDGDSAANAEIALDRAFNCWHLVRSVWRRMGEATDVL